MHRKERMWSRAKRCYPDQFWGMIWYVMVVLICCWFSQFWQKICVIIISFTPKWWFLVLKGANLYPISCWHFLVHWKCLTPSRRRDHQHAISVHCLYSPETVCVSKTDQGFSSKDVPWRIAFTSCILKNFEKQQRPGDHKFKEIGVR